MPQRCSSPLTSTDLEQLDAPKNVECVIISEELCQILHKDPFTIVLSIWAAFQLTWVTMLLCVQLLQVARNLTTYESMRGHLHGQSPADAVTSFVTTGDTSQDVTGGGAGSGSTNGFGSGQDVGDIPKRKEPKASVWQQWKRLLGLGHVRGYGDAKLASRPPVSRQPVFERRSHKLQGFLLRWKPGIWKERGRLCKTRWGESRLYTFV